MVKILGGVVFKPLIASLMLTSAV
ncbi:hypothetical protein MJM43_33315, partial [Salmonella enterica subsp. enterica serovar Montevideo]|nr:hypothetical protein [Salmonella enterica subsp. enterica serovar Montevideo]MDI5036126.1 hypothetical protein [Salmonella enterica subsp. enterica serovar Montevideo]